MTHREFPARILKASGKDNFRYLFNGALQSPPPASAPDGSIPGACCQLCSSRLSYYKGSSCLCWERIKRSQQSIAFLVSQRAAHTPLQTENGCLFFLPRAKPERGLNSWKDHSMPPWHNGQIKKKKLGWQSGCLYQISPKIPSFWAEGKPKGPLQVQMEERTTWPNWCCHGYTKLFRQPEAASRRWQAINHLACQTIWFPKCDRHVLPEAIRFFLTFVQTTV